MTPLVSLIYLPAEWFEDLDAEIMERVRSVESEIDTIVIRDVMELIWTSIFDTFEGT